MKKDLSRLDFFAAHAPTEIPKWFEVKETKSPKKPDFHWHQLPEGKEKKIFRKWSNFQADLPPEYDNYRIEWENYHNAINAWRQKNEAKKYFEWRRYFAEKMVELIKDEGQEDPDLTLANNRSLKDE